MISLYRWVHIQDTGETSSQGSTGTDKVMLVVMKEFAAELGKDSLGVSGAGDQSQGSARSHISALVT